MPGIYGFAGISEHEMAISGMVNSMRLYENFHQDRVYTDNIVSASRCHLGNIGELHSPSEKGGTYVWVEGEAYNEKKVARDFKIKSSCLSGLIAEAYQRNILKDVLREVDGYFCAAVYDKASSTINLISDRYGMRMLYWYEKDGVFAWGSEVKALLSLPGIDKTFDYTSFDCFIDVGHLLGSHTWFKEVKLLEPATILVYNIKEISSSQSYYWTWSDIKPSHLSFDEAVDEIGERFIEAVKARFNPDERVGVAISGGLDSRAILAAIKYLYPDNVGFAYTFGVPGCDDIKIAKEVVSVANWEHKIFYFSSNNWFNPRIEKIWNTDGMLDMMHMHGSEFLNEIKNDVDIILNGFGGGLFTGELIRNGCLNQRISKEVAAKKFKNYHFLDSVENSFYDIDHLEPYIYMNRNRRFINMATVNTLVSVDQRKPIASPVVFDFLMSLPDDYRLHNRLYAAMLQKFFPDFFKKIPWQRTGKPVGLLKPRSFSTKVVNKGLKILENMSGASDSKKYTDYAKWICDPQVRAFLVDVIDSRNAKYKQLTSVDLSKKYLDPHLRRRFVNNSNKILRAATVELYLRKLEL